LVFLTCADKYGRSRGKRTCRCGDCKRHFYSSEVIDRALAMYAESASAASIGGAMEIEEGTMLRWVKKALLSGRVTTVAS